MDPNLVVVLIAFFFAIVALVAIVYRLNDVAKAAIKGGRESSETVSTKAKDQKTKK